MVLGEDELSHCPLSQTPNIRSVVTHSMSVDEDTKRTAGSQLQQERVRLIAGILLRPGPREKASCSWHITAVHIGVEKFLKHTIRETAQLVVRSVVVFASFDPFQLAVSGIALAVGEFSLHKRPQDLHYRL